MVELIFFTKFSRHHWFKYWIFNINGSEKNSWFKSEQNNLAKLLRLKNVCKFINSTLFLISAWWVLVKGLENKYNAFYTQYKYKKIHDQHQCILNLQHQPQSSCHQSLFLSKFIFNGTKLITVKAKQILNIQEVYKIFLVLKLFFH